MKNLLGEEIPLWRQIKYKLGRLWTTISNIPHNIHMICQWIPILWDNWDWDFIFFLKVMNFKLKRMSSHIREEDRLEGSKRTCWEIDQCTQILDRLTTNYNYAKDEEEQFDNRWGKCKMALIPTDTVPEGYSKEDVAGELDLFYEKAREMGSEAEEQADQERSKIIELARKRKEEDYDRLFQIMREKVQNWWD